MQSSRLVILIVVLNAIVAVQPSNAEARSDFQASRRDLNSNQYKRLLQHLISRNVVGQQEEFEDSSEQVGEQMEKRAEPVVWNRIPGSGGLGVAACPFMKSVEGKSVSQCQYECELISGCTAIDIDKNGHCTFRKCNKEQPSLDSNTQYNSYIIHRIDSVWNQLQGKGGLGVAACPFIKSVEGKSVSQCQQECELTIDCDAIDIDAKGHCTFRQCNEQQPPLDANKQYQSYIKQQLPVVWNSFEDRGGLSVAACPLIKMVESQSVSQCQYLCESIPDCNAIDINAKGHCTFRNCDEQNPPLDSNTGYQSYIIQRTPTVWNTLQGHGGLGVPACPFMNSVEGKTVSQCKYECELKSGCTAIDIDAKGHCTFRQCNKQHPTLDANKQYQSYIIQSSPVWKPFKGRGGLNVATCPFLKSVEGKTVSQCQYQCELTSGCDAIDINAKGHCTFRQCKEQQPPLDSNTGYKSYIMENLGMAK